LGGGPHLSIKEKAIVLAISRAQKSPGIHPKEKVCRKRRGKRLGKRVPGTTAGRPKTPSAEEYSVKNALNNEKKFKTLLGLRKKKNDSSKKTRKQREGWKKKRVGHMNSKLIGPTIS